MTGAFPLGVFKDRKGEPERSIERSESAALPLEPPVVESPPAASEVGAVALGRIPEVALKISGFGGQGILFLGMALLARWSVPFLLTKSASLDPRSADLMRSPRSPWYWFRRGPRW